MNWDQIEGKWAQVKGAARERWAELTEDELQEAKGNREQLVGLIQERYGKAREDAEQEVARWQNEIADTLS